jgi:myosin heavy chain 9/10/11/14
LTCLPQIRPLLAATRNDEELRKKEVELALIKERAERDKQERDALQALKMTLETQKRKVEEQLEAERALTLDKDALLERSKKREGQLEEEVSLLQVDLETLDSQLDRAMRIQKEGEEKYEGLKQAFNEAAEHLVRLESEQQEWVDREAELTDRLNNSHAEVEVLEVEKEGLQKATQELRDLVLRREEDVARAKERLESVAAEMTLKLNTELRQRLVFSVCQLQRA